MKNLFLILIIALTSGCSINPPLPKFSYKKLDIELWIIPQGGKTGTVGGRAIYNPKTGICTIELDPSKYSNSCLGHELRHCLEGAWHGDTPTNC